MKHRLIEIHKIKIINIFYLDYININVLIRGDANKK